MTEPSVQLIQQSMFAELVERARASPRGRINHNFHGSADDNPHRFLNVFLRGSYVAPHRHRDPPKSEAFLVLEGAMAVFVFGDDGAVQEAHLLGSAEVAELPARLRGATPAIGVDLAAGVWHTVTALSAHAICYEVKPGPWDAATDKEFAPWAPLEDDEGAAAFLAQLWR